MIPYMESTPKTRPLSPHLQVYKLPMTALMSISHRITGVILCGGCVLIVAFLTMAAMGQEQYDLARSWMNHPLATPFFYLWSFVLYYHLCNGVRHLIWDTVHLLDQKQAVAAGWVVLLVTALLTTATWQIAL